ncbi:MAG: nif-specific transcriptional activator NifA [Candidatus Firestonebacteria bacterium]|nr:nif-specific transcriptional activator NifA [Candidatus Firestonebacteria bacterium]
MNVNKNLKELTVLYEISKVLTTSLDLKVIGQNVLRILSDQLQMERGTLTLLDFETHEIAIKVAYGLSEEEIKRGKYRIGEGITGEVMQKGEAIVVPDISLEPRFLNRTGARIRIKDSKISFICVPIKVGNEILGTLSIDKKCPENINELKDDEHLLIVLASLLGPAIKLKQNTQIEKKRLIDENTNLRNELKGKYKINNMVGNSPRMVDIYKKVLQVSKSNASVLLRGESGTGKELIARAIHFNSNRADGPFIKVSCAAIPETLLEDELFGHEKGAFTGAIDKRIGRFELASGGTLFLDEIGDISGATQIKLLRVIQERKFERLGGNNTINADIRLITATNRNLENAVEDGTFRADLYYRLNVVPIFIPALRERKEDIPALALHFLNITNRENNKNVSLSPEILEIFIKYDWPGNVRELENCIERLVVMSSDEKINNDNLYFYEFNLNKDNSTEKTSISHLEVKPYDISNKLTKTLEEIEKEQIIEALRECANVQAKAARRLGITMRKLGLRIKKYGIIVN